MAANQSPEWRFEQGRKLSRLRDQGVLIIAKGNTVHTLSQMSREECDGRPHDWAVRFSDPIRDALMNNEPAKLIGDSDRGRDALNAHPTPEHYWPLLYAMGARQAGDVLVVSRRHIEFGSVGMSTFVLRPTCRSGQSMRDADLFGAQKICALCAWSWRTIWRRRPSGFE